MHPTLKQLSDNLEIIQASSVEDCYLVIWGQEEALACLPAKTFDTGVRVGDSIEPHRNRLPGNVIRTEKMITEELGPEIFGIPVISVGVPIFDEYRQVIASFTATSILRPLRSSIPPEWKR